MLEDKKLQKLCEAVLIFRDAMEEYSGLPARDAILSIKIDHRLRNKMKFDINSSPFVFGPSSVYEDKEHKIFLAGIEIIE